MSPSRKRDQRYCIRHDFLHLFETKRADDYKQMQEIMADAVPLIPLCYVPFTFAASDKLSGYSQTPLGIYNFKNMSKAE